MKIQALTCFVILSCNTIAVVAQSFDISQPMHRISWERLGQFENKYMQETKPTTILTPPLKMLLGARYKEFMGCMQVQVPMETGNGVLVSRGMLPLSGGDYAAAAFFGMDGELLAVLKSEKKLEYFGDKKLLKNPFVASQIEALMD